MKNKILVTRTSMPAYEEYIEAIKPLWDSHWITNMGTYHKQLEMKLKEYLKVPCVSLMVNGHMALEMTLQAFGFPKGSEVITTPFTFISTTHAIVRNGLVPVFCDVKISDGTIDEKKIEDLITEKTVAILPVHVYGNVCNVEIIKDIADRHGLKVIYDAAHAFGETYKGIGVGNFGDASVFSFHATKVFNTIEGGGVTFADPDLYERLYNLKNFGIRGEEIVEEVGANAKMNEFCAIMGLCNLKNIENVIKSRKKSSDYYLNAIKDVKGISLLKKDEEVSYNYSYFPIIVNEDYKESRDELYNRMKSKNIYCRRYFYPIVPEQLCYRNKYLYDNLSVAKKMSAKVLSIPLYEEITKEEMDRVIETILL